MSDGDPVIDRSCGPEGCEVEWLASERVAVELAADDPLAFTRFATDAGWGDGLPLVPPTEERVRGFVRASGRFPDEHLGDMPPRGGRVTVEKIAINAVLAGAPAEAMALLCAATHAMLDPEFNLFALNTTTSCVVPGLFVNGPARDALGIPYEAGCFGGVAGPAPAIGRALRLLVRNVGGQVVGVSSKSVFGQPGRVTGIVVGEWEERSPWAPLAERRGLSGNAVTVHGCTGTMDVADTVATTGRALAHVIGRSIAYLGTNAFIEAQPDAEIALAIAPPWADMLAQDFPAIEDLQAALHAAASLHIDEWPEAHRAQHEAHGRVDARGRVSLVARPENLMVFVAGGLGNLHALAMHSFGPTRACSRPF